MYVSTSAAQSRGCHAPPSCLGCLSCLSCLTCCTADYPRGNVTVAWSPGRQHWASVAAHSCPSNCPECAFAFLGQTQLLPPLCTRSPTHHFTFHTTVACAISQTLDLFDNATFSLTVRCVPARCALYRNVTALKHPICLRNLERASYSAEWTRHALHAMHANAVLEHCTMRLHLMYSTSLRGPRTVLLRCLMADG